MENVTRRKFIQGTTALAAGAAIGLKSYEGILEYGPIDFKMHLFTEKPIVVKSNIYSDEVRNVFGLEILDDRGHKKAKAEMPLSRIKEVVRTSNIASFQVSVWDEGKKLEHFQMTASVEEGTFALRMLGQPGTPIWTDLENVRRII